ncbi:DUF3152 domain-containing protein [Demequina soli]|uniref:DUF3152 domain-containing protein n=1 Tax=Demequina soli TaxID=1638987 RepID=UPI000784FD21|nr:DUF3152 domain-containing protein [Demequina soli]
MNRRSGGLFAGRGIALPGVLVTLATVVVCFALGLGAGWVTAQVPDWYRAWSADPQPSASPSASDTPTRDVSLPTLEPITRELDDADAAAGVVSLTVPERGEGTFTAVTGAEPTSASPSASAEATTVPTRYVRIDVEDGVTVDEDALVRFVMDTLNDNRGWGSDGRMRFVLTDGAADVRVVLASPYTVAARCPKPHTAATLTGGDGSGSSPAPSADAELPCASQGIAPISLYDWTAGVAPYRDHRTAAREYLVNHAVGHVLGEEDQTCESGRAAVMVNQPRMPQACSTNPWPYPDASTS